MAAKELVARLQKRRERTVDLGGGKSVKFLRPPEADFPSMLKTSPGEKLATWSVETEHVRKYVVGWTGFTEATLLGEAIGASDSIDFDSELWAEVVEDNIEWRREVAMAILESVVDHITKREEVAKNSTPG